MTGHSLLRHFAPSLLVVATLVLGLAALSGCGDSYSASLRWPERSDWILTAEITKAPLQWDPPGVSPLASLSLPLDSVSVDARELRPLVRDKLIVDPKTVAEGQRKQIAEELRKAFGTPAEPHVKGSITIDEDELAIEGLSELKLDAKTLKKGSRLYRQHCLHCHGLPGDGKGPTGAWINPHPRDFRSGIFKFTSTSQGIGVGRKARRDDLIRVMEAGIEGSAMPSFGLLPREELEAMASYVMHLSIRGEVELQMLSILIANDGKFASEADTDIPTAVKRRVSLYAKFWYDTQKDEYKIVPTPYPYKTEKQYAASLKRGQAIFNNPKEGGCVGCHKDYGRQAALKYDLWGTIVRPTDFTTGVYRGGRRPIDIYFRSHSGIRGSGMANFSNYDNLKPRKDENGETIDGMWDVVNFIQALPYKELREHHHIDIDKK